ncbi:MAG: hypothetical protein ACFFEE_05395 [Candidatus Thorarchaeota archaeon]
MKDEIDDLSKTIQALEEQILFLETLSSRISSLENQITESSEGVNFQDITTRLNAVQNLVDRIEIEVDNLEMRVSAIEHMGFRLRTSSR